MRRSFGQQQCRGHYGKGKSFQRDMAARVLTAEARVRMLIMTKVNLAIMGSSRRLPPQSKFWALPWVLYSSGPDSLPTSPVWRWPDRCSGRSCRAGSSSRPGIVCEQFRLPGMLASEWIILFYPDRSESYGRLRQQTVSQRCCEPEQLRTISAIRMSRCVSWLEPYTSSENGATAQGYVSMWSKQHSTKPHDRGLHGTHITLALSSSGSLPSSPTGMS